MLCAHHTREREREAGETYSPCESKANWRKKSLKEREREKAIENGEVQSKKRFIKPSWDACIQSDHHRTQCTCVWLNYLPIPILLFILAWKKCVWMRVKWSEREREMGMQQSQSELKFFLNVYSRMRGSGAAGLKFSIVFCCFVSNNFYPLFFLSLSHFFTIKSNLSLFWKKVGNLKMMSEALFLCHVSFFTSIFLFSRCFFINSLASLRTPSSIFDLFTTGDCTGGACFCCCNFKVFFSITAFGIFTRSSSMSCFFINWSASSIFLFWPFVHKFASGCAGNTDISDGFDSFCWLFLIVIFAFDWTGFGFKTSFATLNWFTGDSFINRADS